MINKSEKLLHNGKKNVLWGAGKIGKKLLFKLIELGIYVDCFCDTNEELQHILIFNKKVLHPNKILKNIDEYNIIISTAKFQNEVEKKLKKLGIYNYIKYKDIGESVADLEISPVSLYRIIQDSYKREIIIYGSGRKEYKIAWILKYVDVSVKYYIDNIENERMMDQSKIKPVWALLDENDDKIMVLVSELSTTNVKVLEKMGLKVCENYNSWNCYRRAIPRKNVLDPNLGYNFMKEKEHYQGFIEYDMKKDVKKSIVILGGSTTDAWLYPYKSWPELLDEKLKEEGYQVKILNGGCLGYRSSQELVKLIRDVIPIKPDIVLSYSGVNDAAQNYNKLAYDQYPFLHPYQIDLFEEVSKKVKMEYLWLQRNNECNFGLSPQWSRFNQFKNNIRIMNAICQEYGIYYHCFLQPALSTKIGEFTAEEKELIINCEIEQEYIDYINEFYEEAKNYSKIYLSNWSYLFHNHSEVYFDICHVYEKGNKIIADAIYNFLIENNILSMCNL